MNKKEKRFQAFKTDRQGDTSRFEGKEQAEAYSKRNGRKKQIPGKDSSHNRDVSSKTIFGNAILCAQFLRDNFDMPILKDVQPDDIEDISERFYPYLGTEFEPDSVKKIRILDIEKKKKDGSREPSFLVSLIEHKSLVDYDVSMQLLRYMICIWTEYRREKEARQKGSAGRKSFRYPPIIPIVYYEGRPAWTAGMRLSDRIGGNGILGENTGYAKCGEPGKNTESAESGMPGANAGAGSEWIRKWIPDFQYELIQIHDYSDQELLDRENEMALIMLINKIQNAADLERFIHIPADKMDRIVQKSPEAVVDIMAEVMENLCFKIDASSEERLQCVQKVKERRMGYLFENMEKMSLQEERRKTEEQRKKTEAERRKTEAQRQKTENERKKAENERKRAEDEHKKAEAERKRAEDERKKAEGERKRAENEHKKAEDEHKKAEDERKRAENERKKAEDERKRAEAAEEKLRLAEEEIRRLKEKYSLDL